MSSCTKSDRPLRLASRNCFPRLRSPGSGKLRCCGGSRLDNWTSYLVQHQEFWNYPALKGPLFSTSAPFSIRVSRRLSTLSNFQLHIIFLLVSWPFLQELIVAGPRSLSFILTMSILLLASEHFTLVIHWGSLSLITVCSSSLVIPILWMNCWTFGLLSTWYLMMFTHWQDLSMENKKQWETRSMLFLRAPVY